MFDPKLVTLDTPHEPNTKFLKKMSENARTIMGEISPFWFLVWKCGHSPLILLSNHTQIATLELYRMRCNVYITQLRIFNRWQQG